MKKIILLFSLIFAGLFLAGCSINKERKEETKSYQNENSGKEVFSIKSEDIQNATGFIYHKKYDAGNFIKDEYVEDNAYRQILKQTEYNGFMENRDFSSEMNIVDIYEKKEYTTIFKNDTYTIKSEEFKKNDIELLYYHIYKNGKEIYTAPTKAVFDQPFKNFVVNEDGWWLLYEKIIINDWDADPLKEIESQLGKNTLVHNGEELAYYDVPALEKIGGKIFYFFKENKDSNTKYYFDGKIFETGFYDIPHDKCCSAGMYNLSISNDGRVIFWGIKNNKISYNEVIVPGAIATKEKLKTYERQAQLIKKREEEGELSNKEIKCKIELKNIVSNAAHIEEYIATINKDKVTGGAFRQVEASEIEQPEEKDISYFAVYEYHSDLGKEIMKKKYKLDLNNNTLYDISTKKSDLITIDKEKILTYKNACNIRKNQIFQARGVQSFWAIEIKDNILTFSIPENDKIITYSLDTIEKQKKYDYFIKGDKIDAHFLKKDCIDPTKNETWPYSVFVNMNGTTYEGCGTKK